MSSAKVQVGMECGGVKGCGLRFASRVVEYGEWFHCCDEQEQNE